MLVMYAVGALAVIAASGFALDIGLAYLTKTRAQNAADAAALYAAKIVLQTGSQTQATTGANTVFALNLSGTTPTVEFSDTQSPFTPGSLTGKFVRVRSGNVSVPTFLSKVIGFDSINVSGTAVAGPESTGGDLCGPPLGICGTSGSADTDCGDSNGCYGVSTGELTLMDSPSAGPGNYGLMDMGSGASAVADAMAGTTSFCAKKGDSKATQPGHATSTTASGLNSRFGDGSGTYSDQTTYPPDLVTTSGITYAQYQSALASGAYTNTNGRAGRRTVLMPILDCSGIHGASTNATVLGTACMFLTRKVPTSGATNGNVYAQMISDPCLSGSGTPTPGSGGVDSRIVLFQAGTQS